MKKLLLSITLLAPLALSSCTSPSVETANKFGPEVQPQLAINQSRQLAQRLGKELKATLVAAIKQGGLSDGIAACNLRAPQISQTLQNSQAIQVGRTSLKLRNSNNAPDDWEQAELEHYANSEKRESYQFVQLNGKPAIRYMKAIATKGVCLNCHGEKLNTDVSQTLAQLYPSDKATGYKLNDIRGAFTITRYLD